MHDAARCSRIGAKDLSSATPFPVRTQPFRPTRMSLPRVSLILLNWNGRDLLPKTLPSVVATTYENLEIIFADNASTDGSADWAAAHFPGLKVLRHPENWGFCRGNNEAVLQATGSLIVLLNSDVEVPPGWLDPLVARIQSDSSIAAVQPKLLQYEDRTQFEYAGGSGGFLDRWGYPFTRGRLFFTLEADSGQYDDARDVFWASGAALLLRRSALDEVGLLDERFYLHMEEIDLCWRLLRAGYRVVVEPRSEVYHIGGSSLPQGNPRKAYFNFRNSLLLLYKNLSPRTWRRVFPVRAALDLLAVTRALLLGHGREAWAILRAYADAHRLKSAYAASRPSDDSPPVLPTYRRSVVIDYFLLHRRTFRELPGHAFMFDAVANAAETGGRRT